MKSPVAADDEGGKPVQHFDLRVRQMASRPSAQNKRRLYRYIYTGV